MDYSINFYIDKVKADIGQARKKEATNRGEMAKVRMRIRWGQGCTASFGAGFMIRADGWEHKGQRCIRGSEHGREGNIASWIVNARLEEMERRAHEVMAKCEDSVTPHEVRFLMNRALGRCNPDKKDDEIESLDTDQLLCRWLEHFVQEQTLMKGWKNSTCKKYHELTGYLKSFAPECKLDEVNDVWLQEFLASLLDAGLRNVTIAKLLDMLNWFLRWADVHGLIKDHSWQQFKPMLKCLPRKVLFLTREELERVLSLDLSYSSELDDARDLFCLLCFTSLRYSDVRQLKSIQVKENHIELVAQKTSQPLVIELNHYSRAILSKHNDRHTPYAMPRMNIQRLNLLLKEIGRRAQLNEMIQMEWYVGGNRREEIRPKWQFLTSHCGRRTFICNSLSMNIPAETVMRWTGHSSYKSMKPYIAVAADTRRKEMLKWDNLLQDRAHYVSDSSSHPTDNPS